MRTSPLVGEGSEGSAAMAWILRCAAAVTDVVAAAVDAIRLPSPMSRDGFGSASPVSPAPAGSTLDQLRPPSPRLLRLQARLPGPAGVESRMIPHAV